MSKYFFLYKNDEYCVDIDGVMDKMHDEGVNSKEVYKAQVVRKSDMFYCNHFYEVGEKGECGRSCPKYKPRNGVSGICQHNRPVYEHGEKITIHRQS